jgi:hypothetical protein
MLALTQLAPFCPTPLAIDCLPTTPATTLNQLRRLHSALLNKRGVRKQPMSAREVMPIYWRRLIELGIPINEAKIIAWAIVRYDAAGVLPNLPQQQLLRHYSRFICRAGLWRSAMLPTTPVRKPVNYSYASLALATQKF